MSKTIKITDEHKSLILNAAYETWQIIGYEVSQLLAEHGERLTEATAREQILEYIDWHAGVDPFKLGYSYKQVESLLKTKKFL